MAAVTTDVRATLDFAKAVALGLSDTPRWLPSRFLSLPRKRNVLKASF